MFATDSVAYTVVQQLLTIQRTVKKVTYLGLGTIVYHNEDG